ncbi:MAG: hypothetical protein JST64_09485 [Actinobacteria bacterium]|nr:hypothetical protein [Actinomycetota bacterium]
MSARPSTPTCTAANGGRYSCKPQNTIAFNRWAAGWIDPTQVAVHTAGSEQFDLTGPGSASGTQLVVAPSATSSRALVTIEARPRTGLDQVLDVGGVAVHVVDQRARMCDVAGYYGGCPSLWRRQGQATGNPGSYDHVLTPGETRTLHGLTITVGAAIGSGYHVTVSGRPVVADDALAPYPAAPAAQLRTDTSGRGDGARKIDLPTPAPTAR